MPQRVSWLSLPHVTSLTDEAYWDEFWADLTLPAEMKHGQSHHLDAILDCFDRYLPVGGTALEVGGAPGQYAAYLHRELGYDVTCLDYSPEGCRKARENFRALQIDARVIQGDLFDPAVEIESHDLVYSLGLIEHFTDLELVARSHLRFVRPGGLLMLGAPNLRGLNEWMMRRLAPEVLGTHVLEVMDLDRWTALERPLSLTPVFKGYVGGIEPSVFGPRERDRFRTPLAVAVVASAWIFRNASWLRQINGPRTSGYMLGIWRADA